MERFVCPTEADTEALGERLGARAEAGEVYALFGELGAGKTALARGFARGAGYAGRVTSPTFAIVGEYLGGRLDVFHFDLYRLGGEDELFEIGWEDYLARGGVCLVEWAERAPGALPRGTKRLRFSVRADGSREIILEDETRAISERSDGARNGARQAGARGESGSRGAASEPPRGDTRTRDGENGGISEDER